MVVRIEYLLLRRLISKNTLKEPNFSSYFNYIQKNHNSIYIKLLPSMKRFIKNFAELGSIIRIIQAIC